MYIYTHAHEGCKAFIVNLKHMDITELFSVDTSGGDTGEPFSTNKNTAELQATKFVQEIAAEEKKINRTTKINMLFMLKSVFGQESKKLSKTTLKELRILFLHEFAKALKSRIKNPELLKQELPQYLKGRETQSLSEAFDVGHRSFDIAMSICEQKDPEKRALIHKDEVTMTTDFSGAAAPEVASWYVTAGSKGKLRVVCKANTENDKRAQILLQANDMAEHLFEDEFNCLPQSVQDEITKIHEKGSNFNKVEKLVSQCACVGGAKCLNHPDGKECLFPEADLNISGSSCKTYSTANHSKKGKDGKGHGLDVHVSIYIYIYICIC